MDNREHDRRKYCEMMDTIHASESLARKVRTMNQNSKVKTFRMRKFAYVAAAVVVVFASSNMVTHAMTGSSWVEKIVVKIDGKEQEIEAEHSSYVKDGVEYEEVEFNIDENSGSASMEYTINEGMPNTDDLDAKVVKEGDNIYLIVENQEVNVTIEIEEGQNEGEIEIGEEVYLYEIHGDSSGEEFDCTITKKAN